MSVVSLLLKDQRVDPSDYNNKAIRMASENDHASVIKELIKHPSIKYTDNISILNLIYKTYNKLI